MIKTTKMMLISFSRTNNTMLSNEVSENANKNQCSKHESNVCNQNSVVLEISCSVPQDQKTVYILQNINPPKNYQ